MSRKRYHLAKSDKKKLSQKVILEILNKYDSGVPVNDICQDYSISLSTLYNYKKEYMTGDTTRIKILEEENQKLRAMYVEAMLKIK